MSTLKFDEGRLMQVLVAPIVSEKATMVAEKSGFVAKTWVFGSDCPRDGRQ